MFDDLQSSVLDALGVVVVVSEFETGTVVALNEAAAELTGFSPDDVIGRPIWSTLLAGSEGEAMRPHWGKDPAPGLPPVAEGTITNAHGEQLRLVWSVVLTRDDAWSPTHVVLTATDAACIATDLQGRITFLSQQAERLLRRTATDVLTHRLPEDWFDPAELQERADELGVPVGLAVLRPAAKVLDRRRRERLDLGTFDRRRDDRPDPAEPWEGAPREWTIVRGDGSTFTGALTVQKATSATRHVGFLVVIEDVSSRDRTHQFLASIVEKERLAAERLRELEEAKRRLVEDISHEFRTPVATLAGFVELLQDGVGGELTDDQAAFVDAIARSGDRLVGLTADLLVLSGLSGERTSLELVPTDLVTLLERVVAAAPGGGPAARVVLDVPPAPVRVAADADRLAWVVRHLLANAVKFTPATGRVDVVLTVVDDQAVVEVADNGPGIPEAEQGDVFAPFFRGTAARQGHIPGTGLGLGIAASVVEGHGGAISLTSAVGRGTTLRVCIPCLDDGAA